MTTFEPIQPATSIKLDLFPTRVLTSDEEPVLLYKDCRVVVTDSHYYIFQEGGTGPVAASSGPFTEFGGSNSQGWTITTPEGTLTVFKDLNCGCGSRLRSFYPFPGVPHAPYIPETK